MAECDQLDERHWVFGYGSLIWRPDFPYLQRHRARLRGWSRRFWQGSHDHRGVPDAPGRVVTLIETADAECIGMAYALSRDAYAHVLAELDMREQNGYIRFSTSVELLRADRCVAVDALVYIATPSNVAFLGDAPITALAQHIHGASGPSGRNKDYLFELAQALRALAAEDDHVFELEAAVRALDVEVSTAPRRLP